jgi:hypothetical protein
VKSGKEMERPVLKLMATRIDLLDNEEEEICERLKMCKND